MHRAFSTVANPYQLQEVILAPVLDEIQANDSNLEPPMVRIRAANNAFVSLDSTADAQGTSSRFTIGGSGQPPLSGRKIKRIAFDQFVNVANSPNINQTNNQIIFRTSPTFGPADTYTAIVPEGYYNTVAQALTALVTALNAAGSPVTFSTVVYDAAAGAASDPQRARLIGVGGTFTFSPDSLMSQFGRYLYGIPFVPFIQPGNQLPPALGLPGSNTFQGQSTANLPIGQILLLSTRWIDIISLGLNEYTKNPSSGNDFGSNSLVARIYITQPTTNTSTTALNIIPNLTENIQVYTNYDRTRQIGSLDFTLLDEYGRILYRAQLGLLTDPLIAQRWMNDYTLLGFVTEI